ncbi:MAG: isoprenyl transferase [Cytophagales bacterium]|nr:isoprenyl transferase [Cytophagales bacterium]
MNIKDNISLDNIPKHVAIIMDGNGRWAKKVGALRAFGHKNGVNTVRTTVEACVELGIKNLTLYAFSTENWNRPKLEINALMQLLVSSLEKEIDELDKQGVFINTIGEMDKLPGNCSKALSRAKAQTKNNTQLTLTLALSYSGRWDLTNAIQSIAEKVSEGALSPQEIDQEIIQEHLSTAHLHEPELLIRTSGEMRISNFLLWEIAYSEIYVTETLWPDFSKEEFFKAIIDYQNRERRFGKTSEQINP